MPRENHGQHAFNAGEWSAFMLGRQDLDNYHNALFLCENFVPMVQGGITRRPGSLFFKTTKFGGDREARLMPFEFGVEQTYQLEFGHQYIRFFTNHGVLTGTAQTIEAITQASPGVMTITGHGYSDGDRLHVANVGGMTQLEGREVTVANKATDTFELNDIYGNPIDTTGYGAFTSGGTVAEILEITTVYTEAELNEIRTTQSADVLYIFHPDHPPHKLVRETATSWTLSEVEFFDGPYDLINTEETKLNPSATSGDGKTITADSTDGINDGDGFVSTDVGRLIRLRVSTEWGYAVIATVVSTTEVTVDIIADFDGTSASDEWRLGLFSDTTGWPAVGTFHEDRLVVGGAQLFPQRLDGSRSSQYENFRPTDQDGTVADDHAVGFVLASADVNKIRWLEGDEKGLLIGTAAGEWLVRPSVLAEAITPSNINAKRTSDYGSEPMEAVRVGGSVVYTQRGGLKLREMVYQFEKDGFVAPDLTVLAEHITLPQVTEIDHQQQPQSLVWAVRSDGVLLGFTFERDHGVLAWHRHEIGGTGSSTGGIAEVESIAVTPSPSGDRDELYMIVKRHINGQDERYIELMTDIWSVFDDQTLAFHLDSGLTIVDSGGFTAITGLWHLEGETLAVLADGAAHPDVTVSNGTVSLKSEAFIASIGYRYNSDAETMPLEAGSAEGTAQGKLKRIERLGLWLVDTLGIKFGPDELLLTEVLFHSWGEDYGEAPSLFTGIIRDRFEGDYDRLGQVYIRADGAFPCNVMALQMLVETQDDS